MPLEFEAQNSNPLQWAQYLCKACIGPAKWKASGWNTKFRSFIFFNQCVLLEKKGSQVQLHHRQEGKLVPTRAFLSNNGCNQMCSTLLLPSPHFRRCQISVTDESQPFSCTHTGTARSNSGPRLTRWLLGVTAISLRLCQLEGLDSVSQGWSLNFCISKQLRTCRQRLRERPRLEY